MALQNVDYQALINDSVRQGDLVSAAHFEQQRNDKIASPEYKGSQTPTNKYAAYLNVGSDMISQLRDTADYNSARSAEQAQIQRDWQVQQNATAMNFNRDEAAKNRAWQEMMSNTAHQREIKDLQAAGLNPVLSVMGGNGASVTSGATASGVTSSGAKGDVDTSLNSALVNLLGSIYNRTTQIEAANINARTQEAVADKYNATSQIVAQIAAAASMYGADSSSQSSMYSANKSWDASRYSTDKHFQAVLQAALYGLTGTKYTANSAKEAQQYSADSSRIGSQQKVGGMWDAIRYLEDAMAKALRQPTGWEMN